MAAVLLHQLYWSIWTAVQGETRREGGIILVNQLGRVRVTVGGRRFRQPALLTEGMPAGLYRLVST